MRYAQGQVAVRLTATGTLRFEWQCNRYAQGQVAVHFTLPLDGERTGPVRSGASSSAGRDGPKPVSATSVSGCALSEAGPESYQERPFCEGESLCNWVDATG